MRIDGLAQNALQMLLSASLITGPILDACTDNIIEARPLRDLGSLTVEQHRRVGEADRIIDRLSQIDVADIADDCLARYGELLCASRGQTMGYVGPVADAFRSDKSAISTIMGPYGSAKTTTCFQKIINSIIWQPTGPDGVKRARWCVVRDTYGHLQANVMADWFMWFPKTKENYNETKNTHNLRFDIPLAHGEVMHLELEMLFRAVDRQSAEELFKGMALTGLWLNEMDTLHNDVFKFGFPRVGRYRPPGTREGGWSGMIGDMNAPAEDNWTYDFNVNKNIGLTIDEMRQYQVEFGDSFSIKFHVQPSGLAPNAENLNNLPKGYYERIQIGMSETDKRRFIHNKFGAVRDGNPVYSQYNDDIHCVSGLTIDPKLPIHIGLDGGGTPAALFGQKRTSGQISIVDEVVIFKPGKDKKLEGLGAKEFGQACGRYWNDHFSKYQLADVNWADPACWYGDSEKNIEDRAWIYKFVDGFNETAICNKLKMKPAPIKANRINPRLEAVREVLRKTIDGQPSMIISDKCKVFREGFNRGYVVTRVEYSTGGGRWNDEPLKNDFSHVHDAGQYLVLGLTKFDGWESVSSSSKSRSRRAHKKVNYGNGFFSHRRS